jgi:hypothetical protein
MTAIRLFILFRFRVGPERQLLGYSPLLGSSRAAPCGTMTVVFLTVSDRRASQALEFPHRKTKRYRLLCGRMMLMFLSPSHPPFGNPH